MSLTFGLLAVAVARPAAGDESVGPDTRAGWAAYTERYVRAAGSYVNTSTHRTGTDTSTQRSEVSFAFSPAGRRAELRVEDSGWRVPLHRLLVANEKYVFELEKGEGKDWLLKAVHLNGEPAAGPIRGQLDAILGEVRGLTAIEGVPLADLADDLAPARGADGGSVLRLGRPRRVRAGNNDLTFKTLEVRLRADPFGTVESARADIQMNKTAGTSEYTVAAETRGGVPVPVRSTRREYYPVPGGDLEMVSQTEYAIDPTARPPDAAFTLSDFGFPEPVGVEWPRPTPRYVWFVLAAVVCGGLAAVVRYSVRPRPAPAGGSQV
ncbi:MAG: hypothetical protein K2X87_09130 [Gemmataceae bacterium]|nr:hypothetical protein [Gemmataceae bacterium]